MLAADKLQLQSHLKQQATALKEKEFQLHHSNLMTVGTQAAVLASLDVTMFIEFQVPPDSAWEFNPAMGGYTNLLPRTLKVSERSIKRPICVKLRTSSSRLANVSFEENSIDVSREMAAGASLANPPKSRTISLRSAIADILLCHCGRPLC